ncbi:MAG: hypothetical protein ACOX89_03315, partial [Lutispora sp.]|jgi:hypothetical protein
LLHPFLRRFSILNCSQTIAYFYVYIISYILLFVETLLFHHCYYMDKSTKVLDIDRAAIRNPPYA